jgi:hypothetical protein
VAIAQRPYPELLPRPAARPLPRRVPASRPYRAGSRVAIGPFLRPMLVASGLTVALVTYVSGYAQMTGAGYQRVRLQAQQRGLRAEQNVLHSDLILHRTREEIETWAAGHCFAHVSGDQYVIHRAIAQR